MLCPAVQDVQSITNPSGNLVNVNSVALILWDIFDARYGSGAGAALLMLLPLGCSFFGAVHTITSASRYICPLADLSAALRELSGNTMVLLWSWPDLTDPHIAFSLFASSRVHLAELSLHTIYF